MQVQCCNSQTDPFRQTQKSRWGPDMLIYQLNPRKHCLKKRTTLN